MSVYYPECKVVLKVLWEDFDESTNQLLQQVQKLQIVAKSVTVQINDYTHADTFECEIDYKNFPFDPRCIRACGISIFIENAKKLADSDVSSDHIMPSDDNATFLGFVDEDRVTFNEESRTVHFEGRDFTALLIDRKYRSGPISITTPLDTLIQSFLDGLKETQKIKVDNRTGESLPTLASFAPTYQLGNQTKNSKPNETYWDVIQDLVGRAGLIAYIELDKLVITKPRVLYNSKQAVQFIYGKNLRSLIFKRKLGRMRGLNIRTVSFNFATKQIEEAGIPRDSEEAWATSLGIAQAEAIIPSVNTDGTKGDPKPAPYLTFRFPNMNTKQLIQIGQKIYEELSRQQIEGTLETNEMEVPDGFENCFDVTQLTNGTPIQIHIDQFDIEGISELSSTAQKARFLRNRYYETNVAQALAQTLGKFKYTFYAKSIQMVVDQESGFRLQIEFINFIELPKGLAGGKV